MYRLRLYRRAFTRYGASNKCGVGKMRRYHSPDGTMAAAFYDSLISRHFSCFDKKKTNITSNVILLSMNLTK